MMDAIPRSNWPRSSARKADEVIVAIAKTFAELTSRQDGAIRQQLIEQLMREIMNYDAEFRREDATGKADEGSKHPDRNDQFEHINSKVVAAQAAGQPVISVDTKKKELIGNYRNGGTDYRPKGDPRRVKVHDFEDKELGKIVPYGVYDVTANA